MDLSGQHTEEDEDEHPLESVGNGEEIGCEGSLVENVQHAKCPGGAQDEQKGKGTTSTGPYVLVMANLRLLHSSVSVHFVNDHSKSQEIDQDNQTRWPNETPNKVIFCAQPTHFIGTIILGAKCSRNGHHHCRASISKDVKVAMQESFVVDDTDHYQIQMDPLNAHPGKRR